MRHLNISSLLIKVTSLTLFIILASGCATMTTASHQPSINPALIAAMPAIDRQGRIAYAEEQGVGVNKLSTLYTIHPDGSERQLITSVNGYIYAPTWSADGSKLAYSIQMMGNYPFIFVYDFKSKTITRAVSATGSNLSPSFSADGRKLLYSSTVGGNADIYELNLEDGSNTQLTTLPSTEVQPSYAADGRSFVYVSDKARAGRPQLYRYDFATKQARRIRTGGYAASPQLSLDGSKIGYLNGRQAAVMTLATGQVANLAETGLDEPARLSPSGKYAVYSIRIGQGNGNQGSGSLVIRSLNGETSYTISSKSAGVVRSPVWGVRLN